MVDAIGFHLVKHLARIGQGFGDISKHLVHLGPCLEPLLLGVQHTFGVVKVFVGRQAQQAVVSLGILLVHKVAVVAAYQFDVVFTGQFHEHGIGLLLQGEGFPVGTD